MSEIPEFACAGPAAVFGDIHGCCDALRALLPQLSGRELFVVGDVCDRGPNTRGVIELLISRGARGVLGNHEEWFSEWANTGALKAAVSDGGMGSRATLLSYGVKDARLPGAHRAVPATHRAWLQALEHVAGLSVCGAKFWMVHAGVSPSLLRTLRPHETVSAIVPRMYREQDYYAHWNNTEPAQCLAVDRPVIMGHKPLPQPLLASHVLGIDTGAGSRRDGRLSVLLLPERRTLSVPAPQT